MFGSPRLTILEFSLNFLIKPCTFGHLLSFDLSDKEDIRATKDVHHKANLVLYTFCHADPFVLTFLYKIYCLSLYIIMVALYGPCP